MKDYIQFTRNNVAEVMQFIGNIPMDVYTEKCPNGKFVGFIKFNDDYETIIIENDYIIKRNNTFEIISQSRFDTDKSKETQHY